MAGELQKVDDTVVNDAHLMFIAAHNIAGQRLTSTLASTLATLSSSRRCSQTGPQPPRISLSARASVIIPLPTTRPVIKLPRASVLHHNVQGLSLF